MHEGHCSLKGSIFERVGLARLTRNDYWIFGVAYGLAYGLFGFFFDSSTCENRLVSRRFAVLQGLRSAQEVKEKEETQAQRPRCT